MKLDLLNAIVDDAIGLDGKIIIDQIIFDVLYIYSDAADLGCFHSIYVNITIPRIFEILYKIIDQTFTF